MNRVPLVIIVFFVWHVLVNVPTSYGQTTVAPTPAPAASSSSSMSLATWFNVRQRMAQVPHRGNGLQEDLGEYHGGAYVEVYAPAIHSGDAGAEQPEIAVRG